MNWIILIGLALYFASTVTPTGWRFVGDGSMNFRIGVDGDSVTVRGDGDFDLAPDGSGVTALASGGYLDIRSTRGGSTRRVRFEDDNGAIARKFFIGEDEQTWGAEADRFVAEVMPIVLRETAVNVDERVAWLLANRGHSALLDEIDLIRSDYSQRSYSVRYAESGPIAPADFLRLVGAADRNMGSDFDLRTTLLAIHDAQMPTGDLFAALLSAGRTLGSDFDARTLLTTLAPHIPSSAAAADAYLEVAATIGSDFDQRLTLGAIVSQTNVPDELVARAIDLAGGQIGSDFDLRTLLAGAAARVGASDALARAYTSASKTIGGDFDQKEALMALASDADLTAAGWRMLLESAHNIGGDFECATLLQAVAPRLPNDETVLAAYRATLATIGGDFEHQRAAAALVDNVGR